MLATQSSVGAALIAPAQVAAGALAASVDSEALTTGLITTHQLDADLPHLRVSWIKWDSGFRESGLQIGDQIIAVDGELIQRPPTTRDVQRVLPSMVGQYAEAEGWKARGGYDGKPVTFRVVRRAAMGTQTLDLKGTLRAARTWTEPGTNKQLLGDGPPLQADDGFGEVWSRWYEKLVFRSQRVLDGGWTKNAIQSRALLEEHLGDEPRVEVLMKKYPGKFANAVRGDFQRVKTSLEGARYELGPKDLEYRELGEKRAREIAELGRRAQQAFIEARRNEIIEPFPAEHPIRGDRSKVTGKLVVLPLVHNRDWVMEADRCWMTVGDDQRGWYFISCDDAETRKLMEVRLRYQRLVTPKLNETYRFIGRIRSEPKMLVVQGRGRAGLWVQPVAAEVGEAVFIDLSSGRFAGEETLSLPSAVRPAANAAPAQVMEAWIDALQRGEEDAWRSLYADWSAEKWRDDPRVYYTPFVKRRLEAEWTRARRVVLGECHDIRVHWVSDIRRRMSGKEFPGAPVIDEVSVELEHVGKFGNEFRAYVDLNVTRMWTLQRRDGGPWRITGDRGI